MCDEPFWKSQLKSSLKVILGHWQWGWTIYNSELLKDAVSHFCKKNNEIMQEFSKLHHDIMLNLGCF